MVRTRLLAATRLAWLAVIAFLPAGSMATGGDVASASLAQPPPAAGHWILQSTGGKHGDAWIWTLPDGSRVVRESMNLRGQVYDQEAKSVLGRDGMPSKFAIRGVTPQGDATEIFEVTDGEARWTSPIDQGRASYASPAYYVAQGGPFSLIGWMVERLLATPDKHLPLLPGGLARAELLTSVEVGTGATRQTVTAWAISGLSGTPLPVWVDEKNRFFAAAGIISLLPEAYATEQKKLIDAQTMALAKQSAALARSLPEKLTGPVAFTNVRIFDAEGRRFIDEQTVVVEGTKITSVGPAAATDLPARARVIEGRGRTLLPGLWDVHMHAGDDYTGPQELSLGVTSVRDPGNDDTMTLDRRARAAKGELLFPTVYASSLIDGKGPYTAQVANVATSEAEALALVRQAKANGFAGVKFYGTFDHAWLRPAVDEARRLGLHVHGHVPRGLRPTEAIDAGYQEVTHINWIVMQAMPDAVIQQSNGIQRFEGPGRYAKDVDLDAPAIKDLLRTMASKGIYSDPTMVAFESLYVPDAGDLSPSYAPFQGTLPPATERLFRLGGFQVPKDLTRADYRASWARMMGLLRKMHEAGVPIVAGTDGYGIEIVHELELYQQAGMSPAEALAAATIVPATLVGQQDVTGSIRAGKRADLVLVEGDPSRRLGDLRQTRWVMLEGLLLDADALRAAAGFSGRPK
ncbi:MAG TPA: amidohydrolase family protein [Steroidobacteraceae bacterium]|nr:amidohydrolase family protein [Steroidobacteraceae bacterium]